MIRRRTILGAGLAVPVLANTTNAAATTDRRAIDATVIADVTPVGYKVTGLAIEYDGIVHSGHSAYDVKVTLSRPDAAPLTGSRTVLAAYPNNVPDFSSRSRPGRYVILETTFPADTTPVFSHGSWIPTYTNNVIIDWLFAQWS